MDTYMISEDYYLEAADVNGDGNISVADISKIYSYLKGTIGDL